MHASIVRTVVFVAVVTGVCRAATLEVPSPYPTVQAAINAASAGDIILVHGGTYGPVVVDKALTIIGDPMPTISNTIAAGSMPSVPPAIGLAGPGSGVVRLVNLKTRGVTDGMYYGQTNSGIGGGGFAELHVEDCDIEPADWQYLSGVGIGEPAIEVSVPYVVIARSRVKGGETGTDSSCYVGVPASGAGVCAGTSTVVVLDSEIRGGDGADLSFLPGCWPYPLSLAGGAGGDGVVADRLFEGGPLSEVEGGGGGDITCWGLVIGQTPDGAAFTVNTYVPLGADLCANGPLVLNAWLVLYMLPAGPASFLLLSTPIQPLDVPGHGWLFLQPAGMLLLGLVSGPDVSVQVPNTPALVGLSVAMQLWDPVTKLSNPYISTIQP